MSGVPHTPDGVLGPGLIIWAILATVGGFGAAMLFMSNTDTGFAGAVGMTIALVVSGVLFGLYFVFKLVVSIFTSRLG